MKIKLQVWFWLAAPSSATLIESKSMYSLHSCVHLWQRKQKISGSDVSTQMFTRKSFSFIYIYFLSFLSWSIRALQTENSCSTHRRVQETPWQFFQDAHNLLQFVHFGRLRKSVEFILIWISRSAKQHSTLNRCDSFNTAFYPTSSSGFKSCLCLSFAHAAFSSAAIYSCSVLRRCEINIFIFIFHSDAHFSLFYGPKHLRWHYLY